VTNSSITKKKPYYCCFTSFLVDLVDGNDDQTGVKVLRSFNIVSFNIACLLLLLLLAVSTLEEDDDDDDDDDFASRTKSSVECASNNPSIATSIPSRFRNAVFSTSKKLPQW
jgi:hypothetical protein